MLPHEQKERIQKLIDACNDGTFQQTTGALRLHDCFCISGLACEVYRQDTGKGEWLLPYEDGILPFKVGHDRGWICAPEEVLDYFGFTVCDEGYLQGLNDGDKYSFEQIATVIADRFEIS
jgi:hypothetical protein